MAHIKIEDLIALAVQKPSEDSILIRGDHGIGKSQVVRQIGQLLDEKFKKHFPVIDVRISQMSDGDMIGLPYTVDGSDVKIDPRAAKNSLGTLSTKFAPPEWYMMCCREPAILFLDEFNRGTPEIMQACFQIVLDRMMNLVRLHPETRVFAAINMSTQYNVNTMDPALLDRLSTYDLAPTAEEWLKWARKVGIHSSITGFISEQELWLDPPKKNEVSGKGSGSAAYDPTEVHPSRRSWERLHNSLTHMNLIEDWRSPMWYHECIGRIGAPAATAWKSYLKMNAEKAITGAQIVDEYLLPEEDKGSKKKKKSEAKEGQLGAIQEKVEKIKDFDKLNVLIDAVTNEVVKRKFVAPTEQQIDNIAAFLKFLPHELRLVLYTNFTKNPDLQQFIVKTNKKFIRHIVDIYGIDPDKPADQQNIVVPDFVKKKQETEKANSQK